MKTVRLLLPLLLALSPLPALAEGDALPPAPVTSAAPDESTPQLYESDDLELEGLLHEIKTAAEAGNPAACRQVYLCYAARGHKEQAQAWSARYIEQLTKKAEESNTQAMLILGTNYLTGKDFVKPDTAKAVTWLLRAADAGEPSASYLLADFYEQQGDTELSRQAYERSYAAYRQLAEQQPDNSELLYWLGYMQQNGIGTAADAQSGIVLLEKAAEMGNAWACSQLFKTYTLGIGTPKDQARAVSYAQKLADKDRDGLMAYATALAYLNGHGVEKDEERGEQYLDMAVAANIPDAIFLKGYRRKQAGRAAEALPYFTQAASMSQQDAMIELALMLLYGDGVEKDEARGLSYLQTATHRLNSPRAPYELARYYESIGEQSLADDWYVAASDAGIIEAMARRGLMHLNPFSNVSWDPTTAFQWWRTGAKEGDADCRLYKNLFIYAFCPLVLTIVFGLPLVTVRLLARTQEQ